MSVVLVLLTAALGGVGAVARFTADRLLAPRMPDGLPFATVVINVVGSFVLGVLVGAGRWHGLDDGVVQVVGAGLLGGFTTFSTVSLDAVQQVREGRWAVGAAIAGGGLLVCLVAGGAGLALMSLV